MSEVQKAIEDITCMGKTFPEEAFRIITANKEEAIPYLRQAVAHAINKGIELDDDYQLHFYAMYLLGEFQDRESFPKIVELATLPEKEADYLLGDCITADLREILYNTYNGDMELLKKSIQDRNVNEFVRSAMLDVVGQLYLDGILAENEWKDFLRQNIHDGRDYDYLYNAIGYIICQCHFIDMLPEIRYMFEQELIDEMSMGKYDSYVDAMFEYREDEKNFCKTSMNAADSLRSWAMFEDESDKEVSRKIDKDFERMLRGMDREWNTPAKKIKIGRNDPCPCGSGKKYKVCCLNKPKDAIDLIESPEERGKWLKNYPYTGRERIEGRIYLEDCFDSTGIEVDKILYLALMNRPGLIWKRDEAAEERRTREYLYLAFQKCTERMEKEHIQSFAEYDEKYSIHYRCEEWIDELRYLLEKSNDNKRYDEVTEWTNRYS